MVCSRVNWQKVLDEPNWYIQHHGLGFHLVSGNFGHAYGLLLPKESRNVESFKRSYEVNSTKWFDMTPGKLRDMRVGGVVMSHHL